MSNANDAGEESAKDKGARIERFNLLNHEHTDKQFVGDECKKCSTSIRFIKGRSCVRCAHNSQTRCRLRAAIKEGGVDVEKRRAIEDQIQRKKDEYWD